MNRPLQRLWVVAYDIEDDAVRRQVAGILKDHGRRVQYSIFECWLQHPDVEALRAAVQALLEEADQVRWYPLCQWCANTVEWQGRGAPADNPDYFIR